METTIIEAEKYLLLRECVAENAEEYRAFWRELQGKYAGWQVDFVYRDCEAPVSFLAEIGAVMLESSLMTELTADAFIPAGKANAVLVTEKNFADFALLHGRANPDMYWSGERIAKRLGDWRIYMRGNVYVMMSLWGEAAEIFALVASNAKEGASLLSVAAAYAFEIGKAKVDYFIEGSAPVELEAARMVGFKACGKSVMYRGTV